MVQLDEANISGYPEDREWALAAINHVLEGIRGSRGVHICFGNYDGQSVQQGFWKDLMAFLNGLKADHLILEFARRGYGELESFRELGPKIGLSLGVADIKDNGIESPDLIAGRIEHAVKILGPAESLTSTPTVGIRTSASEQAGIAAARRSQTAKWRWSPGRTTRWRHWRSAA